MDCKSGGFAAGGRHRPDIALERKCHQGTIVINGRLAEEQLLRFATQAGYQYNHSKKKASFHTVIFILNFVVENNKLVMVLHNNLVKLRRQNKFLIPAAGGSW